MFCSLLVLGMGDWLNGANGASSLIPTGSTPLPIPPTTKDACGQSCPAPDPILHVPMPYVLLGTATIAAFLLLLLIFVGIMLARTLPNRDEASTDPPPQTSGPNSPDNPDPSPVGRSAATMTALDRARRLAAIAQRAEKLLALFVLIGLTMTLLVLVAVMQGSVHWTAQSFMGRVTDLGTAGLALIAIAVLGALVGGAATGNTRPLGLVWDLICFLPRAAHPFAPPCYAERAVPELSSRVTWWLGQPDLVVQGQRRGGRRVVLSAHSLGGVLAVAALLSRKRSDPPPVRLLTYGSQLRAYFGRVFPELLGPSVLGTPPVRAPQLWAPDPWRKEPDWGSLRSADKSVKGLMTSKTDGVLWRNLWRRTDPLGFPVYAYARNDVDRPAEEIDHTGYLVEIVAHSDYPRSKAYETALSELAFDDRRPPDPVAEIQA
jgi:hypothetical protein